LPSTDDGALHMLRLAEIDRCLRHGVLPLRWAPDMAHGYGYPFFNYYASLSSYIGEMWHVVGFSFPQAVAAATISAVFFSGWGAYVLGRDMSGRKAGLVAATAYMYAPYQFYDSAYRGNLAETWALALLPWVLWTGRRAANSRRWADIVPCAVAYAALICTHNVVALISSPVVGFVPLAAVVDCWTCLVCRATTGGADHIGAGPECLLLASRFPRKGMDPFLNQPGGLSNVFPVGQGTPGLAAAG
jgi:uncharacterized membrane protein